jgi:hypothetical protein
MFQSPNRKRALAAILQKWSSAFAGSLPNNIMSEIKAVSAAA